MREQVGNKIGIGMGFLIAGLFFLTLAGIAGLGVMTGGIGGFTADQAIFAVLLLVVVATLLIAVGEAVAFKGNSHAGSIDPHVEGD